MSLVQGIETTFELHTLGWKSFQNLCATIVAEIWGQTIQIYFDSHDGGRDGAFKGKWKNKKNHQFEGSFTVQCKHTSKADSLFTDLDLSDDLMKAKRLVKKGLADNYFIFTNAKLTGKRDEKVIEEFKKIPGLNEVAVYGRESIVRIILEHPRLRMLVPRIYGIGDLSQILDERGYRQARDILSSLGDDLDKFVMTEAYRQSARALVNHGFVLLLGEAMCGKSTIAAALAMGALDEWECSTIKVRNADEFVEHYNPNEKQLFWVDDAFGSTQFDWSSASDWSRAFAHLNSAIYKGSKIIFTSRDYIYKHARKCFKESAIPVMREAQVVINVQDLKKDEREQILYNHIKLGNQPKKYKKEIKMFLPEIVDLKEFSPEIARRLGNSFFTSDLIISKYHLKEFVRKPLELLSDIINSIDDGSRSALALVFMRGGNLSSPLNITSNELHAIQKLGSDLGKATKALETLNGSLVSSIRSEGESCWQFKHPTIRDAFANLVATSPDFLDIYLEGAPLDKLFNEVTCGDVPIEGAEVIVPASQYEKVIEKIKSLDLKSWRNKDSLSRFLSYRCDKDFLKLFINSYPKYIPSLSIGSQLYFDSGLELIVKLHQHELLDENKRRDIFQIIKSLAVETPDSGFLLEGPRVLLTTREYDEIIEHIKRSLLPELKGQIEEWVWNYDELEDPEVYFEDLKSTYQDYKIEFEDDPNSLKLLEDSLEILEEKIEELRMEYTPTDENFFNTVNESSSSHRTRLIFDDVDA